MKESEAQELLEKVEKKIEECREKRKAQRLEFELSLSKPNPRFRSGDPNAPYYKTDREIERLEVKRLQLLEALARGEVRDETTASSPPEEPIDPEDSGGSEDENSVPQVSREGRTPFSKRKRA